jgi:hypothetical protein
VQAYIRHTSTKYMAEQGICDLMMTHWGRNRLALMLLYIPRVNRMVVLTDKKKAFNLIKQVKIHNQVVAL